MKVLVLVPSLCDTSPGQRFRIEQWARYLERSGFHFTFSPFEDESLHHILYQPGRYPRKAALVLRALARQVRVVNRARKFDVVFLYREAAVAGPAIIERLIARTGVPIVYDFDDPIWLPYRSPTNKIFSRLKCPRKTSVICRLATSVVVGNRLLANYAGQHARNVHIVPSTIDLERYSLKSEHTHGPSVTLGWTGSHSTLPFVGLLAGPLRTLAATHSFRMLVISHSDSYELGGVSDRIVAKRWNAATEAMDLHEIDIGVAPFPATGWTPWRCHGKVLQYMAVGVPTVASPVGIISDYIEDGINGFLANNDEEWTGKLSGLVHNPDLRRRMGLAGRTVVEDRYSACVWAPRVREILEAAAATRGGA